MSSSKFCSGNIFEQCFHSLSHKTTIAVILNVILQLPNNNSAHLYDCGLNDAVLSIIWGNDLMNKLCFLNILTWPILPQTQAYAVANIFFHSYHTLFVFQSLLQLIYSNFNSESFHLHRNVLITYYTLIWSFSKCFKDIFQTLNIFFHILLVIKIFLIAIS